MHVAYCGTGYQGIECVYDEPQSPGIARTYEERAESASCSMCLLQNVFRSRGAAITQKQRLVCDLHMLQTSC